MEAYLKKSIRWIVYAVCLLAVAVIGIFAGGNKNALADAPGSGGACAAYSPIREDGVYLGYDCRYMSEGNTVCTPCTEDDGSGDDDDDDDSG